MSGLTLVLDKLRETYAKIAEVEKLASKFPSDRAVLVNLNSMRDFAEELEQQWKESCQYSATEICRYRIIQPENKFSVAMFSKSLLEFQNLFTQIFDAKKNGIKNRATVSQDTWNKSSFDVAFTFPGSLGVAMTIQGERGLDLFNGGYDDSIEAFMDAVNISDEHEVRDTARTLGHAVIKRMFDWSSANVKADYGIDISWTTSKGIQKGGIIDSSSMQKLVDVISKTSDVELTREVVRGTLVGLDSRTKHFRFVSIGDGPDYSGKAHDEFEILKDWKLNTNYLADIAVETTTQYATEEIKRSFKLKSLTDIET